MDERNRKGRRVKGKERVKNKLTISEKVNHWQLLIECNLGMKNNERKRKDQKGKRARERKVFKKKWRTLCSVFWIFLIKNTCY